MSKRDGFSPAEWKAAGEIHLRSAAVSPEAVAFATMALGAAAKATGASTKQSRPSNGLKTRRAVEALLADLLRLYVEGQAGSHGTRPADLPAKLLGFGRPAFMEVVEGLEAAGWLSYGKGRRASPKTMTDGSVGMLSGGWRSRFRLSPEALSIAASAGVLSGKHRDHWGRSETVDTLPDLRDLRVPLIELRAAKEPRAGKAAPGAIMAVDFRDSKVAEMLGDLEAHNAFLAEAGVAGADFVGLRRIFNKGDIPGFRWQWGGRFYSITFPGMERAYEQRSGEERRRVLRLGGEAVGEVDINASQLRLFYALSGLELPQGLEADPYALPGLDRAGVKLWIAQALGKETVGGTRWPPQARREYARKTKGRELAADHDFAALRNGILSAHPHLQTLGTPEAFPVLELQYHESEVLRHAMGALRAGGIPSLPVHDSLIVPTGNHGEARAAIENGFAAVVGGVIENAPITVPRVTLKAA
ncbi:hypothetical protein ABIC65_003330 [Sphingomonas trueperi]|uniref:hypothetical protein n=1 Tax=Sphingomonas trueperi TaxID=53317 RepID=UPI0033996D4E